MLKIILAAILLSFPAYAQKTLTDAFGSTVISDGKGTYSRGGLTVKAQDDASALRVFSGMAPDGWTPPAAPPSNLIETGDFVARFTPQEIATVMAWNPAMVFQVSSAKIIDVTSPRLRAGLAAAVAAGALTQARVDQLLTP